jgi:hypothetical protein
MPLHLVHLIPFTGDELQTRLRKLCGKAVVAATRSFSFADVEEDTEVAKAKSRTVWIFTSFAQLAF